LNAHPCLAGNNSKSSRDAILEKQEEVVASGGGGGGGQQLVRCVRCWLVVVVRGRWGLLAA